MYARSHRQSSGRLWGEISAWAQGRATNCTLPSPQETYGCSWGSRRSQDYIPDKWHPCSQDGSGTNRPLHTVDPGPPEGHRHKLWAHRQGVRVRPWSCGHGLTLSCSNSLLTVTVGVPMVSWKASVTVRTIKARLALAAASLVTAFRQGPCWAAATHCRVECVTGILTGGSGLSLGHPGHLCPHGEMPLTLTEREVEIAKGTVVTPVPLKASAAHALARLWVTEAVGYPRAGTLACYKARNNWSVRAWCRGISRVDEGWHSQWQLGP